MFSTWSKLQWAMGSTGFGWSWTHFIVDCSPMYLSSVVLRTACSLPQKMVNFFHLQIHGMGRLHLIFRFTVMGSHIVLSRHKAWPPGPSSESKLEASWHHNCCILCMLEKPVPYEWCQDLVPYLTVAQPPDQGWKGPLCATMPNFYETNHSQQMNSLGDLSLQRSPMALFSKDNFTISHLWAYKGWDLSDTRAILKSSF